MRCSCTEVAGGLSCPPLIARIISAVEGRMALKNFVRSVVASLPLGAVASALQPWLPGDRRGDSRTSRRQYDCIAVACACSIALALLSPCSDLLSLLNSFFFFVKHQIARGIRHFKVIAERRRWDFFSLAGVTVAPCLISVATQIVNRCAFAFVC